MQCVILAAGEGKRMRPLTVRRPKVMLPLANRPMLEHLVLASRDAGILDFVFVVGYGESEIRDYFGDGSRMGVSIRYAPQRHQKGTADALAAARHLVHGTFLLMNGDMIVRSGDIRDIAAGISPCMGVFPSDHPEDYGAVVLEGTRVTCICEKSANPPARTINAGIYLLDEEIFQVTESIPVSSRGELELTDALSMFLAEGRLKAHHIRYWLDVGYPWDLLDANKSLLVDHVVLENTHIDGVEITGPVSIGEGTIVRQGTCIEGPAIIGKDCRIGPNAYIRGSTSIGDRCHIGHCSEVKNSIVMNGTNLPHFNYVGDSIIGTGCNLGAGTIIANLRHDRALVKACGKETRKRKFGAIVGDGVQFGINCAVNVGTVIGPDALIGPHSFVEGCIGQGTVIGR
ncbi:MAG: NTP transferase domain-containing protein [Methanoregulaceae archaeon]|nr:NTP transferase domain-containing protein [Methanoregulaceae archaeon]